MSRVVESVRTRVDRARHAISPPRASLAYLIMMIPEWGTFASLHQVLCLQDRARNHSIVEGGPEPYPEGWGAEPGDRR